MNITRNRGVLTAIWFVSFFVALAIIVELWFTDYLRDETYTEALKVLSSMYSPYLAAVGMFFWQRRKESVVARDEIFRSRLAIYSSIVWNVVVVLPLVPPLFHRGIMDDALKTIPVVGNTLSWLVAAAIAHYFIAPVEHHAAPGGAS